ncbi:MAG: hypothetical protein ABSH33_05945 [Steroidobacteraceae bacterium]
MRDQTQLPRLGCRRRGRRPAATGLALATLALTVALSGCDSSSDGGELKKINGSVRVLAGKAPRVAETINGNIDVDANAAVTVANTINGEIRLGAHATADTVRTVNGNIAVGPGAHIAEAAVSVNGSVTLKDGAEVLGGVSNVNGAIDVTAAHVAGGIKTVNGDMTVHGGARVEGGLLVQKVDELVHPSNVPTIVIGPGASVEGDLRFERDVKLYVSSRATIGPVIGATPIPFSGDTPPAG